MDMRIQFADGSVNKKYPKKIQSNEVIIVNNLFCDCGNLDIYNKLLDEIKKSGVSEKQLWKLWHGDTHLIADDKKNGKPIVLHLIQLYQK